MAFVNFYWTGESGASNLNAGTTSADAGGSGSPSVTTTGGNWNSSTGVFIAASGTPFASTNSGEYASIYLDADTATPFVGKILSVDSTTQITVDVASIFYGTAPSTSATGRACRVGGAWANDTGLAASGRLFNNNVAVPQATKVNVKAGTFASTTNTRTMQIKGTAVFELAFVGYKTTPGDMDTPQSTATARVAGTDIPNLTFTTGSVTTGGINTWANCAFNSANSGACVTAGTANKFFRCQFGNTSTNSAARAASFSGASVTVVQGCSFVLASTTPASVIAISGAGADIYDSWIQGGDVGIPFASVSNVCLGNIFSGQATSCISFTTGIVRIIGNTFAGAITNGIVSTGTATAGVVIMNNIFAGLGGTMTNGVNNNSGTNNRSSTPLYNDFQSVTNQVVAYGDYYVSTSNQTESANPFTNSGSGDYTLAAGVNARQNASPGYYEGQAFKSYKSMGAAQPRAGTQAAARVSFFGGGIH